MLSVVQRRVVAAAPEAVWRCLTQPKLVSEWFASTDRLAPGEGFRFDFGDGDFFAGDVRAWNPPRHLGLTWRFMDAGPRYDIDYALRPTAGSTEVTVTDRGALTPGEAASLRQGWDDFLDRLRARVETGRPARYEWSPSISAGALVGETRDEVVLTLRRRDWWRTAFPDATTTAGGNGECLEVAVRDPVWGDATTSVTVDVKTVAQGTYVGVVHTGWEDLGAECRRGHRKRYATLWARALRELERRFGEAAADERAATAPTAAGNE